MTDNATLRFVFGWSQYGNQTVQEISMAKQSQVGF